MKTRRIDRYITRTLDLFHATLHGGDEDESAWKAVHTLRYAGNGMIFERASLWCASQNARKRKRGADILAQFRLGAKRKPFFRGLPFMRDESVTLITRMLRKETDISAMDSQIAALGHLEDDSAVPLIASFADHHHADIRYAVTHSLGHYCNHPEAVRALTRLMDDPDREIRDWAIFGVGIQGDVDSEELRAIFLRHLSEAYLPARQEAAAALAKRHDLRVVQPLIQLFASYGDIYCLCKAAHLLLRMESPEPKWTAEEYITALQTAFPHQAGS